MRLAYFTKQVALNGQPVLQAFLTGCQTLGIVTAENSLECDAAVIWSMVWSGRMTNNRTIYNHYVNAKKPVFVLEVGMLHRDRTWKLGVNGTTGTAQWVEPYDKKRLHKLALIARPWRKTGNEIVVVGQRGDSGQWQQTDPVLWYQSVFDQLAKFTDRPIVFRPHPRFRYPTLDFTKLQIPKKLAQTYDSFDYDNGISKAWAVVNFNSGPGSQAILNGVPAFVDQSSLAAPVAQIDLKTIESRHQPDRDAWLERIAHTEWTISELAAGIPQKKLLNRDIFHASST
jgi:hypothetical protein